MIKILKLVNSDDVVAEVEEKEDFLLIKNSYKIIMTPEGLGLMPFMLFSKDKEFKISSSHVLAIGEPEIEIRNAYSSQTGGVVLAKNNMLITD
jgi:hypothetical protein